MSGVGGRFGVCRAPSSGRRAERSYVSGNYFLTIDGAKAGFLKSVDGGGVTAEVINEPAGKSYFVKKHIGQPKYEDFTIQVGFSMSKVFYSWIQQSWSMSYQRMDGSIIALDYQLNPVSEREFKQAHHHGDDDPGGGWLEQGAGLYHPEVRPGVHPHGQSPAAARPILASTARTSRRCGCPATSSWRSPAWIARK